MTPHTTLDSDAKLSKIMAFNFIFPPSVFITLMLFAEQTDPAGKGPNAGSDQTSGPETKGLDIHTCKHWFGDIRV